MQPPRRLSSSNVLFNQHSGRKALNLVLLHLTLSASQLRDVDAPLSELVLTMAAEMSTGYGRTLRCCRLAKGEESTRVNGVVKFCFCVARLNNLLGILPNVCELHKTI